MWSRSLLRSCRGLRTVHRLQRPSSCVFSARFRGLHAETRADGHESIDASLHQFGITNEPWSLTSSKAISPAHEKHGYSENESCSSYSSAPRSRQHSDAQRPNARIESDSQHYDATGFCVTERPSGRGVKFSLYVLPDSHSKCGN